MKNIRKFETIAEFTSAYTGSDYVEPWLSLTMDGCGLPTKASIYCANTSHVYGMEFAGKVGEYYRWTSFQIEDTPGSDEYWTLTRTLRIGTPVYFSLTGGPEEHEPAGFVYEILESEPGVSYNKGSELWLRIPQYMPSGGMSDYTEEELKILDDIVDYFGVIGLTEGNIVQDRTYACDPKPIMLYFVGGLYNGDDGFDPDDEETYLRKFIPKAVRFQVDYVNPEQSRIDGTFYFTDFECFEGHARVMLTGNKRSATWVEGESVDNCEEVD